MDNGEQGSLMPLILSNYVEIALSRGLCSYFWLVKDSFDSGKSTLWKFIFGEVGILIVSFNILSLLTYIPDPRTLSFF